MAVPPEADHALEIVQALLAKSLRAVYLHGSAVAGGLQPYSDVDLLVVTDQPLRPETRVRLVAELLKISGRYPPAAEGRRPLEVIVVARVDLAAPRYPARCEFIYGEWLRQKYERGEIPEPVCDPELTLVLAQARQEATSLFGPRAGELLPDIPQTDIRRAIGDLLPALTETLQGDERNVLLTLARMWRTLISGEFVPKDVAADWAAARLPAEQAAVLREAREAYLSGCEERWQDRESEVRRAVRSLCDRVASNL